MTPGLTITPQGCQPTPVDSRSVTIQCGFTMSNTGTDTLVIVVMSMDVAGNLVGLTPYQLLPGASPVQVPAPAVGSTWLVAAETRGQINAQEDWSFVWALLLGGLAGWTIGEIFIWLGREFGWWQ